MRIENVYNTKKVYKSPVKKTGKEIITSAVQAGKVTRVIKSTQR